MKIIFAKSDNSNSLTFGTVGNNQFFVDVAGFLCQKIDYESYATIADSSGNPDAEFYTGCSSDDSIQKILPIVRKIEF